MTRKDYVKFAAMLKGRMIRTNHSSELLTIHLLRDEIADLFETDNPNFDRSRFLIACGVES